MKKIIVLIAMLIMFGSVGGTKANAYELCVTLPDGNLVKARNAFLVSRPNDECLSYNEQTETCDVPKYASDVAWIKENVKRFLKNVIRKGHRQSIADTALDAITDDYNTWVE